MKNLPEEKLVAVSTTHLPSAVIELMDRLANAKTEYGWLVHTGLYSHANSALSFTALGGRFRGVDEAGAADVRAVLEFLGHHGFHWCLFDADGVTLDNLPTHSW